MSSEHRYVGVARLPQGVDADGARAMARPVLSPVDSPGSRPRGYGRDASHRRRLRRLVVRRWEFAVWACVLALVSALAVVVVRSSPLGAAPAARQGGAVFLPPVGPTDAPCVFEPCPKVELTGPPTSVRIPTIGVESTLEDLVLDPKGQLEAPKSFDRAGWWKDGVVPGDDGPAVIAGHVDSVKGAAVFYDLHRLQPGDLIEIRRGDQTVSFRVTVTEQYPKNAFPTAKVYQPTPGPELRLITCGGVFDRNRLSYRDNIVVYAVRA